MPSLPIPPNQKNDPFKGPLTEFSAAVRKLRGATAAAAAAAHKTACQARDEKMEIVAAKRLIDGSACKAILFAAERDRMMSVRVCDCEGPKDNSEVIRPGTMIGKKSGGHTRSQAVIDPVENTTNTFLGQPGGFSVIGLVSQPKASTGELIQLHPHHYSAKLAIPHLMLKGPAEISPEQPLEKTLAAMARNLDIPTSGLVIALLDREANVQIIEKLKRHDIRIQLLKGGDLETCLSVFLMNGHYHAYMGRGGAPEGRLAAIAAKALGGQIWTRPWDEKIEQSGELASETDSTDSRFRSCQEVIPAEFSALIMSGITNVEKLTHDPIRLNGVEDQDEDRCTVSSLIFSAQIPEKWEATEGLYKPQTPSAQTVSA